jgi:hypothetical protein
MTEEIQDLVIAGSGVAVWLQLLLVGSFDALDGGRPSCSARRAISSNRS